MLGKLLERWVNRYYRKDKKFRSVMLVQGEKNGTLVKACGTKKNLKTNLYIAMIRSEEVRDIVLGAYELYREAVGRPYGVYEEALRAEQRR